MPNSQSVLSRPCSSTGLPPVVRHRGPTLVHPWLTVIRPSCTDLAAIQACPIHYQKPRLRAEWILSHMGRLPLVAGHTGISGTISDLAILRARTHYFEKPPDRPAVDRDQTWLSWRGGHFPHAARTAVHRRACHHERGVGVPGDAAPRHGLHGQRRGTGTPATPDPTIRPPSPTTDIRQSDQ